MTRRAQTQREPFICELTSRDAVLIYIIYTLQETNYLFQVYCVEEKEKPITTVPSTGGEDTLRDRLAHSGHIDPKRTGRRLLCLFSAPFIFRETVPVLTNKSHWLPTSSRFPCRSRL